MLNGIVQKHGGKRTVWINGVPQQAGSSNDRTPESQTVQLPGKKQRGQTESRPARLAGYIRQSGLERNAGHTRAINHVRQTHLPFKQGCGRQHGAALMVMLVILIVGAVAILVSVLSSSSLHIARDKTTADALAQAKGEHCSAARLATTRFRAACPAPTPTMTAVREVLIRFCGTMIAPAISAGCRGKPWDCRNCATATASIYGMRCRLHFATTVRLNHSTAIPRGRFQFTTPMAQPF